MIHRGEYAAAEIALTRAIRICEALGSDRHFPCVQYFALAAVLEKSANPTFCVDSMSEVTEALLGTPEVQGLIRLVEFYRKDYDEKFIENWNEYAPVLTDPFIVAVLNVVSNTSTMPSTYSDLRWYHSSLTIPCDM